MYGGSAGKAQDRKAGAIRRDPQTVRRVVDWSTTLAQQALTAGTWTNSREVASRRLSARDLSDRRGLGCEGDQDGN